MENMNINEYIGAVKRTESAREPVHVTTTELGLSNRMFHSILGMQTEINEIFDALDLYKVTGVLDEVNILEELGDLLYYFAISVDDLSITTDLDESDYSHLFKHLELLHLINLLRHNCGYMLDRIKKTMFYGKLLDKDDIKQTLITTYTIIKLIINKLDSDVSSVMNVNIQKLKKRYPENFNLENAEERDLNAEREILETIKTTEVICD